VVGVYVLVLATGCMARSDRRSAHNAQNFCTEVQRRVRQYVQFIVKRILFVTTPRCVDGEDGNAITRRV
jgi:hypothetical protein